MRERSEESRRCQSPWRQLTCWKSLTGYPCTLETSRVALRFCTSSFFHFAEEEWTPRQFFSLVDCSQQISSRWKIFRVCMCVKSAWSFVAWFADSCAFCICLPPPTALCMMRSWLCCKLRVVVCKVRQSINWVRRELHYLTYPVQCTFFQEIRHCLPYHVLCTCFCQRVWPSLKFGATVDAFVHEVRARSFRRTCQYPRRVSDEVLMTDHFL